jgi:hypothetical protein
VTGRVKFSFKSFGFGDERFWKIVRKCEVIEKKTLFKNCAELLEGIENLCQVIGKEKNEELCKVAAVPRDCKS